MLKTNLLVLLAERDLRISKVSQDTGISRTTLTALAQNKSQGIQLDTLDKICKYLHISPGDFFSFVPYEFYVHVTDLSQDAVGNNFSIEIQIVTSSITHHVYVHGYTHEHEDRVSISFYDIEPTVFDDEPNGNMDIIDRFIKPLQMKFKNDLMNDIIDEILFAIDKPDAAVDVTWPMDLFEYK